MRTRTRLQEIGETVVLWLVVVVVGWALWARWSAPEPDMEPVMEVVQPEPAMPWADSISCPGSDLGEYGCYTIPREER